MSDEEMGLLRPAIPSRATGEPKPTWPLAMPEVPAHPKKKKKKKKKSTRLPLREIREINAKRKKNMKKAKMAPKTDPKRSAAAKLAWKRRREAIDHEPGPVLLALALASKLTHEELGGFRAAVNLLQGLSQPSRKLVLQALCKVFP
jgi:hypothetical protein